MLSRRVHQGIGLVVNLRPAAAVSSPDSMQRSWSRPLPTLAYSPGDPRTYQFPESDLMRLEVFLSFSQVLDTLA